MTEQFNPDAFRAQLDQAGAAFKDLAVPIADFWKALVGAGMDKSAATATVCTYVSALFTMHQGKQP